MPLSPLVSQLILWSICGGALLIAGLIKIAGRESRWEETAAPLHTHTCSRCGRVQRWAEPFDTYSPCRACAMWDRPTVNPTVIDLEDFADADAIRVYLDGADAIREHRTSM